MPPKKHSAPTKAQTQAEIASKTGLSKAQVASVFDCLEDCMAKSLRAHGTFTINGLVKVRVVDKAATKARTVMMFGEEKRVAAKPASKSVRASVLKRVKDIV